MEGKGLREAAAPPAGPHLRSQLEKRSMERKIGQARAIRRQLKLSVGTSRGKVIDVVLKGRGRRRSGVTRRCQS